MTSGNRAGPAEVRSESRGNRSEATTMAPPPLPPNNPTPGGSYLEQFIPVDVEGTKLADSTVKLINTLWAHPMTRVETMGLYNTLPRPANVEALHKIEIRK